MLSKFQIVTRKSQQAIRQFSKVNQPFIPNKPEKLEIVTKDNTYSGKLDDIHKTKEWKLDQIKKSTEEHVVYTWGATDATREGAFAIKRGEHIYVEDFEGKKYIDLSSQAINNNLGYTIPKPVLEAVTKQLQTLHMVYGGLTITEPKAKLAQILSEITPESINGFVFPLSGSEANEVAIRSARLYTGKNKILTRYRSYHGGTTGPLTATGDFRRHFAEFGISGFVKFFDFQSFTVKWGQDQDKAIQNYLAYLEETILYENPNTIAAIMVETVCGSSGVLINPPEIMIGMQSLAKKYNIVFILDEVMAGLGRCGEMFAFQRYKGLSPDILTCAKGLTGSFLPLSAVGFNKDIQNHFKKNALGWGTTYQAHPVSVICAYEVVKYMVENKICEHVRSLEPTMVKRMDELISKHNSLKQGRAIGLFGAFDLLGPGGEPIQKLFNSPAPERIPKFKKKLLENGIFTWVRPPVMHIAPPLVINEKELNTAFDKVDDALNVLDY